MAQQYKCDAPGCSQPARWMETDMDTGATHSWCSQHHGTTTPPPAAPAVHTCEMDDCFELATVEVTNTQTGETERFCHLHYIDFVLGLALKIGEDSGLLPPDGPIPAGEAGAFPGTKNVVRQGRAAAKRRERDKAREQALEDAGRVQNPNPETGDDDPEPDPRSPARPAEPDA